VCALKQDASEKKNVFCAVFGRQTNKEVFIRVGHDAFLSSSNVTKFTATKFASVSEIFLLASSQEKWI
jgi:hypothetical protein